MKFSEVLDEMLFNERAIKIKGCKWKIVILKDYVDDGSNWKGRSIYIHIGDTFSPWHPKMWQLTSEDWEVM